MGLELTQDSTYVGDDYWHWSAWIEGPDDELDRVKKVVYTLHHTFANPIRTVTNRETKFRLETEGWGVFRLYASVVYDDKTDKLLHLDLEFEYPAEARRPTAAPAEAPSKEAETEAARVKWADAVFEGSGMKAVAFAGALRAASEVGGIEKWVNVAGTSAGSIVATLLASGYPPGDIEEILLTADYGRFARTGAFSGVLTLLTARGLSRRTRVRDWLSDLLRNSPLGDPDPPFAAFAHAGRSGDLSPTLKFTLRIIASDISSSRMLVLPDDIDMYEDLSGRRLSREDFSVLDAVKMSISAPFLYTPSTVYRGGRPHYIVDGSLLSTFPVSMFDDPVPLRPTWGFRLHNVGGEDELRYRRISGPFAMLKLGQAVIASVMDAWDKQRVSADTVARTVIIPTSGFTGPGFDASRQQVKELCEAGYEAGCEFFLPVRQYINSFGATLSEAPALVPSLDDEAASRNDLELT
jgi:NTE family protein